MEISEMSADVMASVQAVTYVTDYDTEVTSRSVADATPNLTTAHMRTESEQYFFPQPGAIHSIIDLLLMCIFLIFGSVGNILVILVYFRNSRRMQSTANHFLCSLAVTDFTVCVVVVPMHIYVEVVAMHRRITAVECKSIMVCWHQTLVCSSWILVGISIDRFYSLCRPFDMRIHSRLVRKIIISIWVFSILVACPSIFIYEVPGCRYSAPVGSPLRIFLALGHATVTLFLPLAIIGINYLCIFLVLSKRNLGTDNELSRCRQMNQTRYVVAKRLLLVIAVFVACWLPRTILEIYHSFVPEDLQMVKVLTVYICRNILPYLNSVLNPVLYSMINPNFRHECWDILCCRYNRRHIMRRGSSFRNGSLTRKHYQPASNNGTWL